MTFQKNIPNMSQGLCQIQDLGQSEQNTEIFSKRTHKISKISFEYLTRLESKIQCAQIPAPYMISLYPCTMTRDPKVIKLNYLCNLSDVLMLLQMLNPSFYISCKAKTVGFDNLLFYTKTEAFLNHQSLRKASVQQQN